MLDCCAGESTHAKALRRKGFDGWLCGLAPLREISVLFKTFDASGSPSRQHKPGRTNARDKRVAEASFACWYSLAILLSLALLQMAERCGIVSPRSWAVGSMLDCFARESTHAKDSMDGFAAWRLCVRSVCSRSLSMRAGRRAGNTDREGPTREIRESQRRRSRVGILSRFSFLSRCYKWRNDAA